MHRTRRFATLSGALGLMLVLARCRDGADALTGVATGSSAAAVADTTTNCPVATGNPARVVCLANAFTATLSATQQAIVQLQLTQANAVRWSNLPTNLVQRNGLPLDSLSASQQTAALAVAQAAFSAAGYGTFDAIRKADTYLRTAQGSSAPTSCGAISTGGTTTPGTRPGGPGGGPGGGLCFGEGLYYIAFLGTPSTTAPWILQLGGHHYALNLAMNGTATPAATPYHVAVEPGAFTLNGVTYAPVATRRDAMYAMIRSLDSTQLAAARLSASFDDILLGPGQDGRFPTQEGVLVSSLSAAQQALVKAAIEAWVRDVPAAQSADILGSYESGPSLARTRVSWSGSTDSTVRGSYIRIDGPRVWVEEATQGGVVFQNEIHYHTVWRDKARDYGANFSALITTDTVTTGGSNTAPTIAALRTDPTSGPFSIVAKSCGGLYTACLRFAVADIDGAADAPFKVVVHWGDNTTWAPNSVPTSTPLVAPHTYAAAGTYPVTLTVADARGAATTQSVTLQVIP